MVANTMDLYLCYLSKYLLRKEELGNGRADLQDSWNYYSKTENLSSFLLPVQITVCAISALVSLINLAVLTRPAMMTSSMNILFVALETVNMFSSVAELCYYAVDVYYSGFITVSWVYCLQLSFGCLNDAMECFTNWLSVVIGVWRLVGTTSPLQAYRLLSKRRALVILLILAPAAVIIQVYLVLTQKLVKNTLPICTPEGMEGNFSGIEPTPWPKDYPTLCRNISTEETGGIFTNKSIDQNEPAAGSTHYPIISRNISIGALNGMFTTIDFYVLQSAQWTKEYPILSRSIFTALGAICFFLPCACLTVVTILLVRNMCSINSRKKQLCEGQPQKEDSSIRTSLILIALLWGYVLGSVLMGTTYLYAVYGDLQTEIYVWATDLQYIVAMITNSLSFFAYYYMGNKFRECVHIMLKPMRSYLARARGCNQRHSDDRTAREHGCNQRSSDERGDRIATVSNLDTYI